MPVYMLVLTQNVFMIKLSWQLITANSNNNNNNNVWYCYFDVFLLMVPTTHSNSVVIQTDMYTPRRPPPLRLYPP